MDIEDLEFSNYGRNPRFSDGRWLGVLMLFAVACIVICILLLSSFANAADAPKPTPPTIEELQAKIDQLTKQNAYLSAEIQIAVQQRNAANDQIVTVGANAMILQQSPKP